MDAATAASWENYDDIYDRWCTGFRLIADKFIKRSSGLGSPNLQIVLQPRDAELPDVRTYAFTQRFKMRETAKDGSLQAESWVTAYGVFPADAYDEVAWAIDKLDVGLRPKNAEMAWSQLLQNTIEYGLLVTPIVSDATDNPEAGETKAYGARRPLDPEEFIGASGSNYVVYTNSLLAECDAIRSRLVGTAYTPAG